MRPRARAREETAYAELSFQVKCMPRAREETTHAYAQLVGTRPIDAINQSLAWQRPEYSDVDLKASGFGLCADQSFLPTT